MDRSAVRRLMAAAATGAVLWGTPVAGQSATVSSRAEAIAAQQAEKAQHLEPYLGNKGEQIVNTLEQTFLSGNMKVHPFFESALAGGGFTLGAGYRKFVSSYRSIDIRASITFSGYKRAEVEYLAPRFLDRRGVLSILGGWREATRVGGPSAFGQEAVPPPTAPPATPAAAAAPAETAPGLGKLFREVPRDLWRFLSVDTAVVLGAGGGAAFISHMSDDDIVDAFQGGDPNLVVTRVGNAYGAFATQVGLGFALYGVGRGSGHPHLAIAGADVVRAQIVSQLWTQAIKHTVRRERPDGSENVSFPSGHSASAFSTATVLLRHYGWKAGAPAYALAGVGAAARIRSNKHYLSDVVFGAAMGIAGARTVLHAGRYGIRVAPYLTPGGGAIMFSLAPR